MAGLVTVLKEGIVGDCGVYEEVVVAVELDVIFCGWYDVGLEGEEKNEDKSGLWGAYVLSILLSPSLVGWMDECSFFPLVVVLAAHAPWPFFFPEGGDDVDAVQLMHCDALYFAW